MAVVPSLSTEPKSAALCRWVSNAELFSVEGKVRTRITVDVTGVPARSSRHNHFG